MIHFFFRPKSTRNTQTIDISNALQSKRFYKKPPTWKRYFKALVISKMIFVFLGCMATIKYLLYRESQSGSLMAASQQALEAKEQALRKREMEIARMVALQCSSPTDVVEIGKVVSTILATSQNSEQRAFLEQALPFAIHLQVQKGIPASALVAQAIYESRYGQSDLARVHHNYFGLKTGSSWKGAVAEDLPTRDSGVLVKADFRSYPNLESGFRGYAEKISEAGRYRPAFQYTQGERFIGKLLECGYCPDSDYLSNIRIIMGRHKLAQLENLLLEAKLQAPLITSLQSGDADPLSHSN